MRVDASLNAADKTLWTLRYAEAARIRSERIPSRWLPLKGSQKCPAKALNRLLYNCGQINSACKSACRSECN